MDASQILDGIEEELSQGIEVGQAPRAVAREAVDRSVNRPSPARAFFEAYTDADQATRQVLFDLWKVRFRTRAAGEPQDARVMRRFKQYLSLGANARRRNARAAGAEAYAAAGGAITRIQYLLGKRSAVNLPEYLWVTVYVSRVQLLTQAARDFADATPEVAQALTRVYAGHRRDTQVVRDRARISDARRRGMSANGMIRLTRRLLNEGFVYLQHFNFQEIWSLEVLSRADHGHGLEAANAPDASVIEDLKRIELMNEFLDGEGPRIFNSKIDNALLGVTNVRGILGDEDTAVGDLDVPRIKEKLTKATKKLQAKWRDYERLFIKDEDGDPVLPVPGVTQDGLGQVHTGQLTANQRKTRLSLMGL